MLRIDRTPDSLAIDVILRPVWLWIFIMHSAFDVCLQFRGFKVAVAAGWWPRQGLRWAWVGLLKPLPTRPSEFYEWRSVHLSRKAWRY